MNMAIATPAATKTVDGLGWLQRRAPVQYPTMDGLLEHLKERSSRAVERSVENKKIELHFIDEPQTRDEMNRLCMVVDGNPIDLTHYSFNQLSSLAGAPVDYMRTLPAALVSNNLEYSLRHVRGVEKVKVYHDDGELRAITGPTYGRVHDWQVLNAIADVLDSGRWVPAERHMGVRATDRSMQLFLIDKQNPIVVGRAPNGSDDVVYRGLRISNSEVGFASLAIDGFLFRNYCLNGMIFGMRDQSRFTIRHSKSAPYRWAREIEPAITEYANTDGMRLVEAVNAAKEAKVAKDDEDALKFLQSLKLSKKRASDVMDRIKEEENRAPRTAWDMVQGITALARSIDGTEERADMERLGGQVWERATRRVAA